MSNTPSKAEIEALVKRHGATSYRNRADTQHPAYGFTKDGLKGLIDEVHEKWGTPQPVVQEPFCYVSVNKQGDVTRTMKRKDRWTNIPLFTAPQSAPAPLSRDQIREVFMAHGFTIKEGQTDLKQYVYDAAYALLGTKPAPLSEREAFEAAWEKLHGKRPVLWSQMFAEHKMETPAHSQGNYFYAAEQAAWKLWQARAALAAHGGK